MKYSSGKGGTDQTFPIPPNPCSSEVTSAKRKEMKCRDNFQERTIFPESKDEQVNKVHYEKMEWENWLSHMQLTGLN